MVLLFCSYYTWVTLTYESLGKKFQRNPIGVSEIKSVWSHATHKKGVKRSLLIKGIFYCTWWASGCIYRHKVREYLPELQKKWNVHLEARAMNSTDNALHCHYMQNDECPSTEVCYTGKDYHLVSRWCWNHSKRKESPGFLSLLFLSAIFYMFPNSSASSLPLGKEAMILMV